MSMRVLSCVAAALLGADLHGALAARPAKVDQQQQESVEQVDQEEATEEKPKKVLDVQPDEEEEGANMAEVEAPQESAEPKTAKVVQKSKPVANVQKRQKAISAADEGGGATSTTGGATTAGTTATGGAGSATASGSTTAGTTGSTTSGSTTAGTTGATTGGTTTAGTTTGGTGTTGGGTPLTGTAAYHLSPVGSSTCDFGVTITETKCQDVGNAILADMAIKPGRDYLVSGGVTGAPPGCSIHTLMDWAVTYNTNTQGENDGNYAMICHGAKSEVHGVREGENQCDFGQTVKVDKCLDGINAVIKDVVKNIATDATEQTMLNVGHWDTLPTGCSMHVGAGSVQTSSTTMAFFNTKSPATNDGSYVLVCTGTVVPVR